MLLLVLIWPPTLFSWVTPEEEELFVPHFESVATEGSQPMEYFTVVVQLCFIMLGGCLSQASAHIPKGNNVDHLLMYIDVAVSTTFQFSLAVVNQICSNFTIWKGIYLASF
ncbi:putative ubiquitinyl hydrolase 1 [Helianthus anomalus]